MTGMPNMDANDTFFLSNNSFQQQFGPQLDNQENNISMDQQRGNSSLNVSDSSLLGCDPTPIGTMNINRSGGQQQVPQQLFELMQAMSREGRHVNNNINNSNNIGNNGSSNDLFQQQLFQQQQAAANDMQNQTQQRIQLAGLLANRQQQRRQSNSGMRGMDSQQQRHSLSLGNITGDTSGANALLALQQLQGDNNGNKQQSGNSKKQQKEFLLFVKILLKLLSATQNHLLRDRTKTIVAECTRRNRLGDPAFMPLQAAVEQRLRPVVGEQLWTRALKYVQSYHNKQPELAQQVARFRQLRQQNQDVMRIARC